MASIDRSPRTSLRVGMIGMEDLPKWNGRECCQLTAKIFEEQGFGRQNDANFETNNSEWSSPCINWGYFDATLGKLPSEEELKLYDGFIMTGSHYSVNDNLEWIAKVEDWIRKIKVFQENNDLAPRVVATCFSHQLVSKAFGGMVGKNPHGRFVWNRENVALVPGALEHPFFKYQYGKIEDISYSLYESHGDCALELPKGAKLLGSSKTCDYEILSFGDDIITIQSHPEFSEHGMVDKILPSLKQSKLISDSEADKEMEVFKKKTDGIAIMKLIEKYFSRV